jgi:hypothetical protein
MNRYQRRRFAAVKRHAERQRRAGKREQVLTVSRPSELRIGDTVNLGINLPWYTRAWNFIARLWRKPVPHLVVTSVDHRRGILTVGER